LLAIWDLKNDNLNATCCIWYTYIFEAGLRMECNIHLGTHNTVSFFLPWYNATGFDFKLSYIYVYTFTCAYMRIYVSTSIHITINIYMYAYIGTYSTVPESRPHKTIQQDIIITFLFIWTHIYIYICTCEDMYISLFVQQCVYVYTYFCV